MVGWNWFEIFARGGRLRCKKNKQVWQHTNKSAWSFYALPMDFCGGNKKLNGKWFVLQLFVNFARYFLSNKKTSLKMHCFNALLPRWISVGGKCTLKQCILWQIFFYWRKYRAKLTNNNSTTPPFSVIYFCGGSLRKKLFIGENRGGVRSKRENKYGILLRSAGA